MKYFLGALIALAIGLLIFSLVKKPGNKDKEEGNLVGTGIHKTTIKEVIQTTNYTYLKLKEGMSEYWAATILDDAKVGEVFTFTDALEMVNFTSKELNRTFPKIYFINDQPAAAPAGMPKTMGKPKVESTVESVIPQSPGGVSVGEIYKNRDQYAGKKVRVKGKVAKVNEEVMDKNWVHLQDGTSDNGLFDLTVTTLEKVKVGDVAEFEGVIAVNRDFGAGYTYEVILEEGKLVK